MAEPLPRLPAEPSEADYDAFCETVMASERGRWFLAEYARRHRKADTDTVLAALHRIEDMVRVAPVAEPVTRLRDELRALAAVIREARGDLASPEGGLSSAAKVMALLQLLEERIAFAIAPGDDRMPLAPPEASAPIEAVAEAPRAHLTVVAQTAEPARVEADVFPSAALLPPLDATDAGPNVVVITRNPVIRPANPQIQTVPTNAAVSPFADVMALSEEERIALFS